MKININDGGQLQNEFGAIQLDFGSIHDEMEVYLQGYKHNFFYAPRPGMSQKSIGVNLCQVFADKLWHHTSEVPKVAVPIDPDERETAEKREKIVMATLQQNGFDIMWGDFTFDGSILGACVARTVYNVKNKRVEITRHDPRRSYWQKASSGQGAVTAFWTATPMTKEAIYKKYGKYPKGGEGMTYDVLADGEQIPMDGKDYFLVVTRDDEENSVEFVGSQILKSYKHQQGGMPVDVAIPYRIASYNSEPYFYLSKLKDLQAEFNELWRRRANIVRKLGNPLVYGRGIYKQNQQEIKEQLATDGGFVPLKENGELAILTIPETSMIDSAISDCFSRMKDVAGFPTATFGESVGANTSGDALGMYFTPTQKMITHYNKAYKSFLEGIGSKILRSYDKFSKFGEAIKLDGYVSQSSIRTMPTGEAKLNRGDGFSVEFTKEDINGKYLIVTTPQAVTPKDDIAYKRFILDSVTNKFMSRTTGLDEIGMQNPEDEFKLLQQEQQDPFLNPEGTANVMQNDPSAQLIDEGTGQPFQNPMMGGMGQAPPMPQGMEQGVPSPDQLLQGV